MKGIGDWSCAPIFLSVITLQMTSPGPIILNVMYMFLSPSSSFPFELLIHISNQLLDIFTWMPNKHLKISKLLILLKHVSPLGNEELRFSSLPKLVSSLTLLFLSIPVSNLTAHNVASSFKNTANLIPF